MLARFLSAAETVPSLSKVACVAVSGNEVPQKPTRYLDLKQANGPLCWAQQLFSRALTAEIG